MTIEPTMIKTLHDDPANIPRLRKTKRCPAPSILRQQRSRSQQIGGQPAA
jgi:hypothetical protein